MTPGFSEPSRTNPGAGESSGFARMPTWLPSGTLPSKLLPSSIAASSVGAPTSRYLKRRLTGRPSLDQVARPLAAAVRSGRSITTSQG